MIYDVADLKTHFDLIEREVEDVPVALSATRIAAELEKYDRHFKLVLIGYGSAIPTGKRHKAWCEVAEAVVASTAIGRDSSS